MREVPLKVVVMSATLETEKLSEFLYGCPIFHVSGRTYPVKELFCDLIGPKDKLGMGLVKEVLLIILPIAQQSPIKTAGSRFEQGCSVREGGAMFEYVALLCLFVPWLE